MCPDAGVVIQELSQRIALTGGAALIADYGHDGTKTDTFRGFCGHKLHDVLIAPGMADLTADVDFSYLRRMAQGQVASLGPITQQTFLKNMGIDVRLKILADKSHEPSVREQLLQGYDMLMNPKKMGERFHFLRCCLIRDSVVEVTRQKHGRQDPLWRLWLALLTLLGGDASDWPCYPSVCPRTQNKGSTFPTLQVTQWWFTSSLPIKVSHVVCNTKLEKF